MDAGEHLTGGTIAVRLIIVVLLVLLNGFFVAAEFALVGARRSKIDQMVEEGDRSARVVRDALRHLDRYLSATQLGITLASLALGWVGEPALAATIDLALSQVGVDVPAAATHSTAAIIIAFAIITFLHIVFGELAPKSMALVTPEGVSKFVAPPLILFARVMRPFIWALNGVASSFLRLFGVQTVSEAHHVHSAEELRLIVLQSRAQGTLDESGSRMLAGVFDFHEKKARDVMRPRTEVAAIEIGATTDEIWAVLRRERYSRYPVYHETLDDVVGVLVAKDLWLHPRGQPFSLRDTLRKPLYVPDSRRAELVLNDLRTSRASMAIVLDEYGGTAGVLTIEDLVEEVIGDITDEYDFTSRSAVETNGVLELDGTMSLIDARSDHRLRIPEGEWSTLGGYAFSRIGRLPHIGDRAPFPGGELEVVAMDARRIAAVRVHRDRGAAEPDAAAPTLS